MAIPYKPVIFWSNLSYFLVLLFYLGQQMALDYYLIQFSEIFYSLVVCDAYILILLLSQHSTHSAMSRYSTTWVVHTWVQTVKLLLYFFILDKSIYTNGFVLKGQQGWVFEISFFFSLSTAIYAFMSFRFYRKTSLNDSGRLTQENVLETDLIVHVLFDLLDLFFEFKSFLVFPSDIITSGEWLRPLIGVIISVALFFHGYSFPSGAGKSESSQITDLENVLNSKKIAENDNNKDQDIENNLKIPERRVRDFESVYISRKHAALVGICLVDVPLLGLRIYSWIFYPTIKG